MGIRSEILSNNERITNKPWQDKSFLERGKENIPTIFNNATNALSETSVMKKTAQYVNNNAELSNTIDTISHPLDSAAKAYSNVMTENTLVTQDAFREPDPTGKSPFRNPTLQRFLDPNTPEEEKVKIREQAKEVNIQNDPIIKALNSEKGRAITGFIGENSSNVPLKGVALLQSIGNTTYDEAYKNLMAERNDPTNPTWERWLMGVQDSGFQSAIGVLLSLGTGVLAGAATRNPAAGYAAGQAVGAAYYSSVSANAQIQDKGRVESLNKIAIDTAGDMILSGVADSILKQTVKPGFSTVVKNITKGSVTEGGTEVTQDFLSFGDDYAKASSQEERDQVVQRVVQYVKDGQMLDTFMIAGISGGAVTGITGAFSSGEVNPNIILDKKEQAQTTLSEIDRTSPEITKLVSSAIDTPLTTEDLSSLDESHIKVLGLALQSIKESHPELDATNIDASLLEIQNTGIQIPTIDSPAPKEAPAETSVHDALFNEYKKKLEVVQKQYSGEMPQVNEYKKRLDEIQKEYTDGIRTIKTSGESPVVTPEAPAVKSETKVDPLLQEAKKYSTPEEFVKAQGNPIYRGSAETFSPSKVKEAGTSFSKDEYTAGNFHNGTAQEYFISPQAKVAKFEDIPKNLVGEYDAKLKMYDVTDNGDGDLIAKWARKNGYDAVDMSEFGLGEMRVLNGDIITNKSQLTDLYNKAQGGVEPKTSEVQLLAKKHKDFTSFAKAVLKKFPQYYNGMQFDFSRTDLSGSKVIKKYPGNSREEAVSIWKELRAEKTQKEKVSDSIKAGPKTIKQIAEETQIIEPNIRRILGVGAKEGVFERVEKGVYVLSKDGVDTAWIEAGDAKESLARMVTEGKHFDSVILDPAYFSRALIGGNRGIKKWDFIHAPEFAKVMSSVSKLVSKDSHVYLMLSGARTAQVDMAKYVKGATDAGFIPIGEGGYQKLFKNGEPVTNVRAQIAAQERIILLTLSGKAKVGEIPINLNFRFIRPSIAKSYSTEKPAGLMRALIMQATVKGESILDPFAGSGVTGEQAVKEGRKVTLVEKSEKATNEIIRPRVRKALEESKNTPKQEVLTQIHSSKGVIDVTKENYTEYRSRLPVAEQNQFDKVVSEKSYKGVTETQYREAQKNVADRIFNLFDKEKELKKNAVSAEKKMAELKKKYSGKKEGTFTKKTMDAVDKRYNELKDIVIKYQKSKHYNNNNGNDLLWKGSWTASLVSKEAVDHMIKTGDTLENSIIKVIAGGKEGDVINDLLPKETIVKKIRPVETNAEYAIWAGLETAEAGYVDTIEASQSDTTNDRTIIASKSTFPSWIPSEYRLSSIIKPVLNHVTEGTLPKAQKQIEFYNLLAKELDQSETPVVFNIDDKKIDDILSKTEVENLVKKVLAETNPSIRAVLQFQVFSRIVELSNDKFIVKGAYISKGFLIKLSRATTSKDFISSVKHEIRHHAFMAMPTKQREEIIAWYKGLKRKELIDIFGTERRLDGYLRLYNEDVVDMADEASNYFIDKQKSRSNNPIFRYYQDIIEKFAYIFNRVFKTTNTKFAVYNAYKNVFRQIGGKQFAVSPARVKELIATGSKPGMFSVTDAEETTKNLTRIRNIDEKNMYSVSAENTTITSAEMIKKVNDSGISIPPSIKRDMSGQDFTLMKVSIDKLLGADADAKSFVSGYKGKAARNKETPIIIGKWQGNPQAVMDGWHRLAAFKNSGIKEVYAYVSTKSDKSILIGEDAHQSIIRNSDKYGKVEIGSGDFTDMVARERFNIPQLEKVSFGGSDRDVYDLGNGMVLKVAKTARGLVQNHYSSDWYAEDNGLIPKTIEVGKNYLVKEKVLPPDAKTKAMVKELQELPYTTRDNKYAEVIEKLDQKYGYEGNGMYPFGELLNYGDILVGDLKAIRNWGTRADGTPIMIDEGTLNGSLVSDSINSVTGGTKNLNDPEFRAIYDQSRRAKKEHGDTDNKSMYALSEEEHLADAKQALRDAKGLSPDDIMKKHPDIQLKRDVPVTDIHGVKKVIPAGEALTPYELKGNKVLLQDGETYIVSKNQFQNIKGQSITGEAKPFAPELKGTEESVKGNPIKTINRKKAIEEIDNGNEVYGIDNNGVETLLESAEELEGSTFARFGINNADGETKYANYQLPGGKNYKEILIKAPSDKELAKKPMSESQFNDMNDMDSPYTGYDEYLRAFGKHETVGADVLFSSSHWDEPNVISHLRLNERTAPDGGKVTFMEELQSDWAREGRDKGFINPDIKPEHTYNIKEVKDGFIVIDETGTQFNKKYPKTYKDKTEAAEVVRFTNKQEQRIAEQINIGKIEGNPLLKNWQELSIKRALMEAVSSGSEYFAWINGEQTAARYNLSTQLEYAKWESTVGGKSVSLKPTYDKPTISVFIDESGKINVAKSNQHIPTNWAGKTLDQAIGKGLAEKIMAEPEGNLSGRGLNIGGEWANNLYDKQVKDIVEKVTGGKVETLDMVLRIKETDTPFYSVRLRDELTPEDVKVGEEISKGSAGTDYVITEDLGDGKFRAVPISAIKDQFYKDGSSMSRRDAMNNLEHSVLNKKYDISTNKSEGQQAIKITPEIKARILGEAPPIKKASGLQPFYKATEESRAMFSMEETPSLTTEAGALRVAEVIKAAWEQVYGVPMDTKVAQALEPHTEVFVKGSKISFTQGKQIERKVQEQRTLERRRKNVENMKLLRKEISTKFKDKATTKDEKRRLAVEYIKTALPQKLRGSFLNMVKDARYDAAVRSADKRRALYERSELVKSIEKIIDKIHTLPTQAQRDIVAITSQIDMKKRTTRLMDRIKDNKVIYDSISEDMQKNTSRAVLKELGLLEKTPFGEVTTKQLMDINLKVQQLSIIGRYELKQRKELRKLSDEQKLEELKKTAVNLDALTGRELFNTEDYNTLSTIDKIKYQGKKAWQKMRDHEKAMIGTDRVVTILDDGNDDGTGANSRLLLNPVSDSVDIATTNINVFKEHSRSILSGFQAGMVDEILTKSGMKRAEIEEILLRLDEGSPKYEKHFWKTHMKLLYEVSQLFKKKNQDLSLYAHSRTVASREKLIRGRHYTNEQLVAIEQRVEGDDNSMMLYDFMRSELDKMHPKLSKKYTEINPTESLGMIEMFFPNYTDYTASEQALDSEKSDYASVAFSSLKSRVENADQILSLGGWTDFQNYMEASQYYIDTVDNVSASARIIYSKSYEEMFGKSGQDFMKTWLRIVARRGGVLGRNNDFYKLMDFVRTNIGPGKLGLRATTIAAQATALANATARIGEKAVADGTMMMTEKNWRVFMFRASAQMKNRAGGDVIWGDLSQSEALKRIQEISMEGIRLVDLGAAGVTWLGAYKKRMGELGLPLSQDTINEEARRYADRSMRMTQGTASFVYAPQILFNENRSFWRTIHTFETFVLANWGMISRDLPATFRKDKVKGAKMAAWLAVNVMANAGIKVGTAAIMASLFGWGDDDKEYKDVLIDDIIGLVPYANKVVSGFRYKEMPIPALQLIKDILVEGNASVTSKKEQTRRIHNVKLLGALLTLFGVPSAYITEIISKTMKN